MFRCDVGKQDEQKHFTMLSIAIVDYMYIGSSVYYPFLYFTNR